MPKLTPKRSGFVVTPEPIARELVRWAVRRTDDTVLDLGAGEGVFLVEAGRRLQELGVGGDRLAAAICGVEKDPARYGQTVSTLHQQFGVSFPGIRHADLFDCEFPQIAAIVGNPPYVRRASLDNIDEIHGRIIHNDLLIGNIPRLADLYAYFLLYAERFLVSGGRLAVIISSSWLDTRSGEFLKHFLVSRFRLHAVVACEARMFEDALVKSVLLIAEKGEAHETHAVKFVRLREFRRGILTELDVAVGPVGGARFEAVRQTTLRASAPWRSCRR